MLLQDKVAIITGAASARGIGRATATTFAQQGARVVILDLDASAARDAAASLGGSSGTGANVATGAVTSRCHHIEHFGRMISSSTTPASPNHSRHSTFVHRTMTRCWTSACAAPCSCPKR